MYSLRLLPRISASKTASLRSILLPLIVITSVKERFFSCLTLSLFQGETVSKTFKRSSLEQYSWTLAPLGAKTAEAFFVTQKI